MTVWIGVDEAGYGPNLGPLVVCASVWRTSCPFPPEAWIERLFPTLRRIEHLAPNSDTGIVIDDSKLVYQSGKGLGALEKNVLALSALCGGPVEDACRLRNWLDPKFNIESPNTRWCGDAAARGSRSPQLGHTQDELHSIAEKLTAAGVGIHRFAGRVLFPEEFNRQLLRQDNKAAVLSEATIEIVRSLVHQITNDETRESDPGEIPGEIIVLCDKHGGRDRYFSLLTHFFTDERIEILREGEAESAYRWRNSQGVTEIRFCAKAERFPPTAAASMMAKYVRELCMAEWNAFWGAKIPGLAPTAGYPVDAKRYRKAISDLAKELGIEESHYWRRK